MRKSSYFLSNLYLKKGMNRLSVKRRNTQLSHFSSAFDIRNTRWMAFYLRIKKQRSGNTSQSKIGWNSYPYQKRVFHEIAFLFGLLSARRRKGEGGLEKFNRGKKSIRLLRALFRYENTLVNCRRKNKIASWFEARSSYRNV